VIWDLEWLIVFRVMGKDLKGFGDLVAKATNFLGIKKTVDVVAKKLDTDCGCDKRQDTLNRMFRYKSFFNENPTDKIFVQIASYRDPELIPTIKDCISKAKFPERLTFGICWQHSDEDEWDNLDEFKENPNFTIMDVPWNESKGLCWARHNIQKMYNGEKYTLQIDSHHRFEKNWDSELITMMGLCNTPKPILTSYAGQYDPKSNKKINLDPYKMVAKNFTQSGTILFYPESIPNYKDLNSPIPGRFVSGHFFFTIGTHCKEYKYDPNLYFAGDEISLSIRSYTLGYDIFHPHKLLIWHEYTRKGRIKHWDDFTSKNQDKIDKKYHELDDISKKRLRKMLREEENDSDITGYDIGKIRTHEEYELYAGIDFKNRILHQDTIKGINPPTLLDPNDNKWRSLKLTSYNLNLSWDWDKIKNENIDFIFLGIEGDNELLHRIDLNGEEYTTGKKTTFNATFESYGVPKTLVVWPYSKGEWLNKQNIKL
jgi:hypothetical protein